MRLKQMVLAGAMVVSPAVVLFMVLRNIRALFWAWAGDTQSGNCNTNAPIPMAIQENLLGDNPLLVLTSQELLLQPIAQPSEDVTLQDSQTPQRLHKVGAKKDARKKVNKSDSN